MSGTPEQEPSIEEILASIRQIISDDDEGAPAASAEPEPVVIPQPAPPPPPPPPAPKEDILELKDPLPEPARPVIDMEDSFADEKDEDEFEDEDAPLVQIRQDVEDSILSETAKSAALSGFSKLASNIPLERGTTPHRSSDGSTLEDIVRDMLNPMLRVWLDENLPTIIEKLVQKELEKLARRASDD